jgi:hypothetical protein
MDINEHNSGTGTVWGIAGLYIAALRHEQVVSCARCAGETSDNFQSIKIF